MTRGLRWRLFKLGALWLPTSVLFGVLRHAAPATGTAGRFTPLTPSRLIDTRDTTKVAANGSVDVPVLGQGGVPASGVSAVVVTVVATNATAPGFVTVHASGTTRPATSTLNATRVNGKASNLAVVPVGANGAITVFSETGAHIVVDVVGWYGDASAKGGYSGLFVAVSPSRVLDTRSGVGAPAGAVAVGGSLDVTLTGVGGIPAFGASSAIVNVTAVRATQAGFVTVYPTGQSLTEVSSLNVDQAGQTTPSLVSAKFGTGGKVTVFHDAGGHLLADVAGWFTS